MRKLAHKPGTVPLRLNPADRKKLERAAAAAHLPLSTWVRQAALRAAEAEQGTEERLARVNEILDRLRAGTIEGAKEHAERVQRSRDTDWQR